VAFALGVGEGYEHKQATNKKSHESVPSRRAAQIIAELSQPNVNARAMPPYRRKKKPRSGEHRDLMWA
jgi:hypothetical protein